MPSRGNTFNAVLLFRFLRNPRLRQCASYSLLVLACWNHAGVPNQSCISFSNGAIASGGSGHCPRSPVSPIQTSSAARRRSNALRGSAWVEWTRFRISCGSASRS